MFNAGSNIRKLQEQAQRPGQGMFGNAVDSVGDAGEAVGNAIGDSVSSGWDVISGNRDWRRNKAEAERNRDFQERMANTEVQRRAADLAAAGINPVQAGNLSAHSPAGSTAHSSNTAGAIGGALNTGISLLNGITGLRKAMAEVRKTNSESDFLDRSFNDRLSQITSGVASTEANTAESVIRARKHQAEIGKIGADTDRARLGIQMDRLHLPGLTAESDFYKRFGWSAQLAERMRNPWQSGMLVAGQGERAGVPALNSASDYLSNQVSKGVLKLREGADKAKKWVKDDWSKAPPWAQDLVKFK